MPPRGSNLIYPFFLPANFEQRWEQTHLRTQLEEGEKVCWLDLGASGLLAHPWIRLAPPIGSSLWDVAITDGRLIAVRHLLAPIMRRKVRVFPLGEIIRMELQFHTTFGSVILSLKTADESWKLKMLRMALDYAAAERTIREVYPEVAITGLPDQA